jgi:5-carboxymethyl-2-hydroxymuconate isomerase
MPHFTIEYSANLDARLRRRQVRTIVRHPDHDKETRWKRNNIHEALKAPQPSFWDGPKDQTPDLQLHIGNLETPDSRLRRAPE